MRSPNPRAHTHLIVCAAALASLLFGVTFVPKLAGQSQARHEWTDYEGGPDGSRFMPLKEISKSNIGQLAIAWSYPHAETGFNPIVAQGVIYTRARNGSLVALEASTGKEIWIHEGLQGMTGRGVNYWESKDGADRRLIFS